MSLILVTGASGFLAAHVIDSILALTNCRIRGTLRSLSKKDDLLKRFNTEERRRIEFVEVGSLESDDLSTALDGVDLIAHTASPFKVNVNNVEEDLLRPAVEGTMNILRCAAKQKSVKRIAMTSSFAAVLNPLKGAAMRSDYTYTSQDWNPLTWKQAVEYGGSGSYSYTASKALAEKAAWTFMETNQPSFQLAAFNPPMIYGPALQPGVHLSHLNTSSAQLYALISSLDKMSPDGMPQFCHARDVADAHIRWLVSDTGISKRYLLCGGQFSWGMAVHYIAKVRPQWISRLPKGWEQASSDTEALDKMSSKMQVTDAIEELGIQFKSWQETLLSSLDSLVALE